MSRSKREERQSRVDATVVIRLGGRIQISNQNTISPIQGSIVADNQQVIQRSRRKTKFKIKSSTIAVYASAFVLIVALVFIGYRQPQGTAIVANALNVSTSSETSVNDVVAANVAAGVAQVSNLPIANNVTNLAVSAQIDSEFAQTDNGTSVIKPQLISSASVNRLVESYTVAVGDTVNTLATKFGISKETIKWANNLTSDNVNAGTTLKILPINGVLYTVKSTDTIDSIATKYAVDKTRLVLYNDLDVSGLVTGASIILPDATLPVDERPGYVAPYVYTYSVAYGYSGGDMEIISSPYWNGYYTVNAAVKSYIPQINSLRDSSAGNKMTIGNCTWWAWERRLAIGNPLPSGYLGDAGSWGRKLALGYGYRVDKSPEVGAVFEDYGHVGIVESINYDNAGNKVSFTTSEMNVPYITFQVVKRTVPASNFNDFYYIH